MPSKHLVLNITVKLTREMRLRFWIAALLLRLAGWLINCDVEIEKVKP